MENIGAIMLILAAALCTIGLAYVAALCCPIIVPAIILAGMVAVAGASDAL